MPSTHTHVIRLVSGTAGAQLISLAALPIITRLYSPQEIGELLLYITLVNFFVPIGALRLENALMVAPNRQQAYDLAAISLLFVMIGVVLVELVFAGMLGLGKHIYTNFGLVTSLCLLVFLCLSAATSVFRSMALREGNTRQVAKAMWLKSGTNVTGKVGFGLSGLGVEGLIIAEALSSIAAFYSMGNGFVRHLVSRARCITIKSSIELIKQYKKYPKYEYPSTMINSLARAVPIPALALLHGPEWAGYYGLAYRVAALPNAQIGRAVADVFQMRIAEAARNQQRQKVRRIYTKALKKLLLFGIWPMLAFLLAGEWLLPLVLGQEWSEAGQVVVIIAPWLFAAFVTVSLSRVFLVVQRQELKLVYDLVLSCLTFGVFIMSHHLYFEPVTTIILLSVVNVIAYGIFFLLSWYAIVSYSK